MAGRHRPHLAGILEARSSRHIGAGRYVLRPGAFHVLGALDLRAARRTSAKLHRGKLRRRGHRRAGDDRRKWAGSEDLPVEFSKQKKTLEISSEQSVLAAAKKGSVRLPSSCSNGVCGTCKSKLVSGSVEMNHNGGIRQREVDAGFFLPCCSKPLSDLVIDR